MEQWLSRKQACDMLGISMPTLNRYMKAGKITYYKNAGYKSAKTKFKLKDVLEFIEKTRVN